VPKVRKIIKFAIDIIKRMKKIVRSYIYFRKFDVGVHGPIVVVRRKNIRIGKHCSINRGVLINGLTELIIGDYVVLSPNCMILDSYLDIPLLTTTGKRHHIPKAVRIGDYCWIGSGAILLPGVELGPRTIVGAGSVVTKSFSGNVVVAGNPARVIKKIN
jgi:maltose O-acetyltransferase